jgi:hypothetical protein
MIDDNLGDWRMDTVGQTAAVYGDAPIGSPIRLMSVAKHKKYSQLSFVTPSPSALCLNVAIEAAARAEAIRPRLSLSPVLSPFGKRASQIRDESTSDLYYFFEQAMIAITMSFQAIEVFANANIGRRVTTNIVVKRKSGDKTCTPAEAERELSTEEKLGQVLPTIFGVNSPRGNRAWQSFKKLKQGRDATVHLKSHDIYTRNNINRESLFFYYLRNDARDYPTAAIKVISHFCKDEPRWLRGAKEHAERDSRFAMATAALEPDRDLPQSPRL